MTRRMNPHNVLRIAGVPVLCAVWSVCVSLAAVLQVFAAEQTTGTTPRSVTVEQIQDELTRATALAQRLETPANRTRLQPLVAHVEQLAY